MSFSPLASLSGNVSELWGGLSEAGGRRSVSPSLSVTFLSGLQRLVHSLLVPDYKSPFGPLSPCKGRTFYNILQQSGTLFGHKANAISRLIPLFSGLEDSVRLPQTFILLPCPPSSSAPGPTCSWVL